MRHLSSRLDALEAREPPSAPPVVKFYHQRRSLGETAAEFRARALAEHAAFPGARAILVHFVRPGEVSPDDVEEES